MKQQEESSVCQILEQADGGKMSGYKAGTTDTGPITSWQTEREKVEAVTDFILSGLQNHWGQCLQPQN